MFDAQKEIVYWFTFGKKTPSLFFCFGSADFVYMAATQRQLLNDDLLFFFFHPYPFTAQKLYVKCV